MPFAVTRMDPEIIILSELRQKDNYTIISLTWNLKKMTQMNLFTKQIHSNRNQSYGNEWGETNQKFEINLNTAKYKIDNQ